MERPENYDEVVRNIAFTKRCSPLRFEYIAEKLLQVLFADEPNPPGYEDWTQEDAEEILLSLENSNSKQ